MNKGSIKRISHIVNVLFKHGLGYFIQELGLKWHLPFTKQLKRHKVPPKDLPIRLRKIFEELGGSFIKLGQLLSLRPDLVPREYCDEFKKLLDRVPPMPFSKVREVVEKSIGRKISDVFSEFEHKPIGSASIAQVHKAKLKSGKSVVVKVKRENIDDIFTADIHIMHYIASKIERKFAHRTVSPKLIVDEFEKYTKRELKFILEARNINRFYDHFKKSKTVVVPQVFWQYTTDEVLIMDFLDGEKLSKIIEDKNKYPKKLLASRIVDTVFSQIMELGLFHADLHPGNVLIMKGNKIGLLDFGITGMLNEELREQGLKLHVALINKDPIAVTRIILKVGDAMPDADIENFKLEVEKIVNEWYDTELKQVRITRMMQRLFESAVQHKIKMPADLVLLAKALVTAEATACVLDPKFNFVTWAEPRVIKLLKKRHHPKQALERFAKRSRKLADVFSQIPEETLEMLENIKKGRIFLDIDDTDVKRLGTDINTSSNRVSYAMIIAALLVSGALLIDIKPLIGKFSVYTFVALIFAAIILISLLVSIWREQLPKYFERKV